MKRCKYPAVLVTINFSDGRLLDRLGKVVFQRRTGRQPAARLRRHPNRAHHLSRGRRVKRLCFVAEPRDGFNLKGDWVSVRKISVSWKNSCFSCELGNEGIPIRKIMTQQVIFRRNQGDGTMRANQSCQSFIFRSCEHPPSVNDRCICGDRSSQPASVFFKFYQGNS